MKMMHLERLNQHILKSNRIDEKSLISENVEDELLAVENKVIEQPI